MDSSDVEYMIVGAYALAFHGVPRYTGDLDLLIKADPENAQRILKVLEEFGFGSLCLSAEDFTKKENVVQLGLPPVRVDLLTSLSGISWDQAVSHRESGTFGDVSTYYIGKEDYILNKRACGRHKDLADIEALGESAE